MSASEGKDLAGIARSIDRLFSPPDAVGEDDDSGVESPPEPPNVTGDPLTGAPVLPDLPRSEDEEVSSLAEADESPPAALNVHVDEPGGEAGDGASGAEPPPPILEASAESDGSPPPLAEPKPDSGTPPLPDADKPSESDSGPPTLPDADKPAEPDTGPPPLPDAAPSSEPEGGAAAAETRDAVTETGETEDEDESTPLDEAVEAYLDGERARADEIRRLAEEMLERRELDAVARSVGRLAAAAGEPADEETLALAESISSRVVLGRLAIHVGAERDEGRREAYYRACRNLGEPMARAIRDDLAESTDRHARRIHCEALVEMGAVGRAMIEEMVMDENRFLVRNAVTILGDTGGDRAVELVTSALANPDARVRREALRSLAKLGDEDSGDLVLGLLEDSDRDVRIAAAVAAGELHVERALRHVIRMLDETKDPEEAIPLIRALGHLGDPGAVPSIEKHAVRTLFSKPRTDVRIAAYRALHQIGTPHARRLLNQAVDDKEPAVKAAVKEMLGMH